MSQPDIPLKLRKDKLVFLMMWHIPLVVMFSTLCKLMDFNLIEPFARSSRQSYYNIEEASSFMHPERRWRGKGRWCRKREIEEDTSVVLPPSIYTCSRLGHLDTNNLAIFSVIFKLCRRISFKAGACSMMNSTVDCLMFVLFKLTLLTHASLWVTSIIFNAEVTFRLLNVEFRIRLLHRVLS